MSSAVQAALTRRIACGTMGEGVGMRQPLIAITTDFGQSDGYVGIMKGVILGICPEATLVDIAHDIRPQAVRQAAFVLSAASPYLPPGTVHLVVIDPGVGSWRRPILVRTKRATYVAPDNGVLDLVLRRDPAVLAIHLTNPAYHLPNVSATFHGRDVFAPAAAHVAAGAEPVNMGDPISPSELVQLPVSDPVQQPDGSWLGEVIHIDRFGNLISNLTASCLADGALSQFALTVAGVVIAGSSGSYATVGRGDLIAYVGSSGHLEIAVRDGAAAARLGVDLGTPISLSLQSDGAGRQP